MLTIANTNAFNPSTIVPIYPSTISRSYPGEMGIALHYREFHWAQRGGPQLNKTKGPSGIMIDSTG